MEKMHSVKRTYGKNNAEKVCRLCSSNSGIIVLNIFDSEGKKRRILSLINACLPVKVSENDPLPKVICHHCLHKLEVFREFQESCLKSEETLRNGATCSVTYPAFRSASQDYIQEHQETVTQFSAEIVPMQDPLLHHQSATAVVTAEEERTVSVRRAADFEHSQLGQLEAVMVKKEPEDKSTEEVDEDSSKWHDTRLEEEDGTMQTEQAELDLLPPDDEEIKSEVCATIEPPIISYYFIEDDDEDDEEVVQRTPHAPRKDPTERLSGDMRQHKLEAIVGPGKKKYPQKPCRVCAAHKKRKDTRYVCSFCKVPLHKGNCFTRYHTVDEY